MIGMHSNNLLRKAASSLSGILQGMSLDGQINEREVQYLEDWLLSHQEITTIPQVRELATVVHQALEDGVIDKEEQADLLWLCDKILADNLGYDDVSDSYRELHALLGGVTADGVVNVVEVRGIQQWLAKHDFLKNSWPYDEVETLVHSCIEDGKISDEKHNELLMFFSEFVALYDDKTLTHSKMIPQSERKLSNLIQIDPDIVFENKTFVFTGKSPKMSRSELGEVVIANGGKFAKSLTQKTDYLIINADGSSCWQYSCYGRKIEAAVKNRKDGLPVQLIHEVDFWDAIEP